MARSERRHNGRQEVHFICRCLRIEEWPAPDRDAWASAVEAGGLIEPGGPGGDWSLASRRKTSKGYGRFLPG